MAVRLRVQSDAHFQARLSLLRRAVYAGVVPDLTDLSEIFAKVRDFWPDCEAEMRPFRMGVVQLAISVFGRFCFDGRNESMEISMANGTDGNGTCQNFQNATIFFRFLHCCCLFESCGGVDGKKKG